MTGKFIAFEGIDSCGKTTQFLKASEFLFRQSKKNIIVLTREPTCRKYGMQIREMLSKKQSPEENAEEFLQLYLKDRKDHLENVIGPALSQGCIVLCDRFLHSTLAYQQAQGQSLERLLEMHAGIRKPDLCLIFDLPAETAMQRSGKDNARKEIPAGFRNEKFEKEEFLEKVRQNYLRMPESLPEHNIKVIDASGSIEAVWEKTRKEIEGLF